MGFLATDWEQEVIELSERKEWLEDVYDNFPDKRKSDAVKVRKELQEVDERLEQLHSEQ